MTTAIIKIVAKTTFSTAMAVTIGVMTRPAVKQFCGLENRTDECGRKYISKDLEDEEVDED